MDRAYLAVEGSIQKPPVVIRDDDDDKGRFLVASRTIQRGETIFTERALTGAQVPDFCSKCHRSDHSNYKVRACQHCFRSLEPASSLIIATNGTEKPEEGEDSNSVGANEIPMDHLWPVLEYPDALSGESQSDAPSVKPLMDHQHLLEDTKSRRVICINCRIHFCSRYCAKCYLETTGNCCPSSKAINGAIHGLSCHQSTTVGNDDDENDSEDNDNELAAITIDPVFALTTRMLCMLVQRHRSGSGQPLTLFNELCGDTQDITPLRLGDFSRTTNQYTMSKGYDLVSQALSLTVEEQAGPLSLDVFHKLAAVAQRNGILLTTKSPFQDYYGAILRNTGGRGSDRQQQIVSEIARVLGAPDGKLSRDMDGLVEDRCGVKMAGLFTLTAAMNHSCDPNAEIRSGYDDCHIDIVAKRTIEKGEEINISYLNLGPSDPSKSMIARNRRRRQLESKYLFLCCCSRCTPNPNDTKNVGK